jgi:hypothetical protein
MGVDNVAYIIIVLPTLLGTVASLIIRPVIKIPSTCVTLSTKVHTVLWRPNPIVLSAGGGKFADSIFLHNLESPRV